VSEKEPDFRISGQKRTSEAAKIIYKNSFTSYSLCLCSIIESLMVRYLSRDIRICFYPKKRGAIP